MPCLELNSNELVVQWVEETMISQTTKDWELIRRGDLADYKKAAGKTIKG